MCLKDDNIAPILFLIFVSYVGLKALTSLSFWLRRNLVQDSLIIKKSFFFTFLALVSGCRQVTAYRHNRTGFLHKVCPK